MLVHEEAAAVAVDVELRALDTGYYKKGIELKSLGFRARYRLRMKLDLGRVPMTPQEIRAYYSQCFLGILFATLGLLEKLATRSRTVLICGESHRTGSRVCCENLQPDGKDTCGNRHQIPIT